jgi:hypothetical protein
VVERSEAVGEASGLLDDQVDRFGAAVADLVGQIRLDTPGRAYYRRKLAAGKTRAEAMRCLKRRISDALYRQLLADATTVGSVPAHAGPGGHRGASLQSSAAGSHPHINSSDQPLPGPAPTTLPAPTRARKSTTSRPLQPAS